MAVYEKMQKTVREWKEGYHVISRGYKLDCYPEKVYGDRDAIIINGDIATFMLWDTPIVIYNRKVNSVKLYHGGWKTKLTRERMNDIFHILKLNYCIEGHYETRRTIAGVWKVLDGYGVSTEFNNGLTIYVCDNAVAV